MARSAVIILAALFVAGSVAGWSVATRATPVAADASSGDAPPAADVDLLAAKGEAQALAVSGRLADAHAAYRGLAARTVGREFRGPLTWDLAERVKSEQDRLYWIIMTRTRGADLAFFRGRAPTSVGPADPDHLASGRRVSAGPAETPGFPSSP
jgi:hypothetical protein